jgi:hypothetical protein
MAYFGAAHFDSSARFDETVPVIGKKTMKKIIVKLELDGKSDTELKQYSQDHMDKVAKSTAFPTLTAGATKYKAVHDGFSTALGNSDAAQKTAQEMTKIKDAAREALEVALTQDAHTVEATPGVTEDMVLNVGFAVKGAAVGISSLGKAVNLSLSTGDNKGEVDAHWNRVPGAKSYEVQWSPDPFTDASWKNADGVTKSKTTLAGLTSGSKIWVRVRALGASGPGAWSNEVLITVP